MTPREGNVGLSSSCTVFPLKLTSTTAAVSSFYSINPWVLNGMITSGEYPSPEVPPNEEDVIVILVK